MNLAEFEKMQGIQGYVDSEDDQEIKINKQSWKDKNVEKVEIQAINPAIVGYRAGFANTEENSYLAFKDGLKLKKYDPKDFEEEKPFEKNPKKKKKSKKKKKAEEEETKKEDKPEEKAEDEDKADD